MPPVEFEPTNTAGERPQTYALDRAATGTGIENIYWLKIGSQKKSDNCPEIFVPKLVKDMLRVLCEVKARIR
jgi:hypothetical protein